VDERVGGGRRINMKKYLNKYNQKLRFLLIGMMIVWISVLFFRSGLHVIRIYKEFSYPIPPYYEDFEICGDKPIDEEKLMYYRYINLGIECEN
jgi:hypothetical protein